MIRKDVVVSNSEGLQSRPAALLVQVACKFASRIMIERGNKIINAKSMMGVLSLGVGGGQRVTIVIEGEDEQEACDALMRLIHTGF